MFKKKKRHKHIDGTNIHQLTTLDLIRKFLIARIPVAKEKMDHDQRTQTPPPPPEDIQYLAIVLDGVVEDVMRAQPRLVALLLSGPEFIEFNPEMDRPQIGQTRYENGKFVYLQENNEEQQD